MACFATAKDGVSYSENLEETVWNQSFEMASARAVTRGNYLAIGDIGSNQIRIFNESGQVGSVVTSYPIVDIAVASQGVVASILSEGSSNYIDLYSNTGEQLVTIRTNISDMGYPLDFALSEDGEKLAVSYLNVQDGTMSTTVVFYNFGSAGPTKWTILWEHSNMIRLFPKWNFWEQHDCGLRREGFAIFS